MDDHQTLRRDLRLALKRKELFLEYQPIVAGRSIAGYEALLRWRHPVFGLVPPVTFIPIAEADGLMPEIGVLALRQACTDALNWPQHQSIAVNLSPAQFLSADLTDSISQTLDSVGFPAERLILEITESVLLERTINNLDILNILKLLGIRIALDDFGTEYSSLAYLKNFPFDYIKIDKYFISDLIENENSRTIVDFVIGLAHGLGMAVKPNSRRDGSSTRDATICRAISSAGRWGPLPSRASTVSGTRTWFRRIRRVLCADD